MNEEKYKELLARAERAKTLTEEIAKLQAANPLDFGIRISFKDNNNNDLLSAPVLKTVIQTGRYKLIADKEQELETVLNARPKPDLTSIADIPTRVDTIPSEPVVSDVSWTGPGDPYPYGGLSPSQERSRAQKLDV